MYCSVTSSIIYGILALVVNWQHIMVIILDNNTNTAHLTLTILKFT